MLWLRLEDWTGALPPRSVCTCTRCVPMRRLQSHRCSSEVSQLWSTCWCRWFPRVQGAGTIGRGLRWPAPGAAAAALKCLQKRVNLTQCSWTCESPSPHCAARWRHVPSAQLQGGPWHEAAVSPPGVGVGVPRASRGSGAVGRRLPQRPFVSAGHTGATRPRLPFLRGEVRFNGGQTEVSLELGSGWEMAGVLRGWGPGHGPGPVSVGMFGWLVGCGWLGHLSTGTC